jgi:hypothetical protein
MKTFLDASVQISSITPSVKCLEQGWPSPPPPGCVMLTATAFVNYVYTTIITQLFGVYVHHLL